MSTKQFKEFISSVFSPVSHLGRKFRRFLKRISKAVRRELLLISRRAKRAGAGFVLPTVTMVMLVVVLLTLSIAFRSFERVNQARNVKINQSLLSASTPALDRAKAKLGKLLEDQTKTPSDAMLLNDLQRLGSDNKYIYRLPDEEVVRISFDMDGGGIKPEGKDNDINKVDDNEAFNTAWRFPIDTDGNGKFDTYNLYGVFLRNPTPDDKGIMRERKPLDARTTPFSTSTSTNKTCQALANSILVGGSGWYLSDAKLKKSFFVYAVNVPITETGLGANYETFKGNTGTTALEFQQDWTRTLPTTNAVVYQDDLVMAPGATFRLNGRIVASSNLMLAPNSSNNFVSYLISGTNSCYFNAENSKIFVGGNVIAGRFHDGTQSTSLVHLYPDGADNTKSIGGTSQSLTGINGTSARTYGFDNQAYNQRIASLIADFKLKTTPVQTDYANYPEEIRKAILEDNKDPDVAIENYLRDRTRKVPFAESSNTALTNLDLITEDKDSVRPADAWVNPVTAKNLTNTAMAVNIAQLPATQPDRVEKDEENDLGDRILVGNNLPYKRWFNGRFVVGNNVYEDVGTETDKWEYPDTSDQPKRRSSQIKASIDVGATDRDGFWELMAGTKPEDVKDGMGGLRLVTGAGIYDRTKSFLPPPYVDDPRTAAVEAKTTYDDPTTTKVEEYRIVWPDTMPMSPGDAGTGTGDLQMRATAVYHYAIEPIKDKDGKVLFDNGADDLRLGYQKPVACISSYYDPTDKITSRNPSGKSPTLADVSGEVIGTQPATGRSNNGIVYGPPVDRPATAVTPDVTTGLFAETGVYAELYKQANSVFPNGRFVNELLRNALAKTDEQRTLAEKSAIDAESCSLGILDTTGYTPLGAKPAYIPDGAIKEVSFLNPREVKAIHADNPRNETANTGTRIDETVSLAATDASVNNALYNQPIEERQPLEIRATQIDLNVLRMQSVVTGEYLLPNSGIIFATRNDALADRSNKNADEANSKSLSTSDFILDPTRRPNGIVLTNGAKLSRMNIQSGDPSIEKGLIMVSNLPAYIKGDFNKHTQEEFKTALTDNWSNFYTRQATDINPNFACRTNDSRLPGCTTGDDWRSATILADAVTLLSDNFRYGFRNEGDFDLNNNSAGAVAIPDLVNQTSSITAKISLRESGLHNNYFGVNGLSSDSNVFTGTTTTYKDIDYSKPNSTLNSSYFNNFVTPIQRRANFSEYLMETCFKLPASSCTLKDWVIEYDGAKKFARTLITDTAFDITKLNTGTTAKPPKNEYQRFPRRIAAYRNRSNRLELTNDNTIQLLGIDSNAKVKAYPYKVSTATEAAADRSADIPRPVDNALVYWTTRNINNDPNKKGKPYADPDLISLENDQPLYWYPSGEDTTILNPDMPDIGDYSFPNTISKYTFCSSSNGSSENYIISKDPGRDNSAGTSNQCPGLNGQIFSGIDDNSDIDRSYADTTHTRPAKVNPPQPSVTINVPAWDGNSDLVIDANLSTATTDDDLYDEDGNGVLAYRIPNYIFNNATATGKKTITIYGSKDQVIVLKPFATQQDDKFIVIGREEANHIEMFFEGGIEPNNVFWLADGRMPNSLSSSNPRPSVKVFNPTVGQTHLLGGNFFGSGGEKLELGSNIEIMGRVIGFNGSEQTFDQDVCVPAGSGNDPGCLPAGTRIIGVSTPKQPLFVPLLNTYVPGEITAATAVKTLPASAKNANLTNWLQRAKSQKYNLILGSHDTPTRPGETNGSFENFPRFIELWNGQTAEISGGFYQLGRSKFGSAPFAHITGTPNPVQLKTNTNGGFDYKTTFGASGYPGISSFPYYNPPTRKWGYDVGLLSQIPDLFAQRLSTPNPNPSEFFREVGRDDPWVKALLCGEIIVGTNSSDAVSGEYRPKDCSDYGG